jgi:hypothetical protein
MYNDESIFIYKFLSSRLEKDVIHIGKVAEWKWLMEYL